MTTIKEAMTEAARIMRGDTPAPPADPFDIDNLPFGVAPGNNKLGTKECPKCGKPPTQTGMPHFPEAFMFRDSISAEEYTISGLCQACQDVLFARPVDDV
jgi:hypothetical protein